jgi:hypothetical protein
MTTSLRNGISMIPARQQPARSAKRSARIGVPVGEVYTSQFNRAYETAVLAGFKDIVKSVDITEGGLVVSPNENDRRTAAFPQAACGDPKARHRHSHQHP